MRLEVGVCDIKSMRSHVTVCLEHPVYHKEDMFEYTFAQQYNEENWTDTG